jgi:hypothetical protein
MIEIGPNLAMAIGFVAAVVAIWVIFGSLK